MYFDTHLNYVRPQIGFGGYYFTACWKLWFVEEGDIQERQAVIDCHVFPVKPTKKQIRKLRRQFRNENKVLSDILTSGE